MRTMSPVVPDQVGAWLALRRAAAANDAVSMTDAAVRFGRSCFAVSEQEMMGRIRFAAAAADGQKDTTTTGALAMAAVSGRHRELESLRWISMLVEPLSGFDTEARFLADLWAQVRSGKPVWLATLVLINNRSDAPWLQRMRVAAQCTELLGDRFSAEAAAVLHDEVVVVRGSCSAGIERFVDEAALRTPGLTGTCHAVPPDLVSVEELTWWLSGVLDCHAESA